MGQTQRNISRAFSGITQHCVSHVVLLVCRQHVYLSMAARNPRRGTMCEPPSVKRIDLYCHSDLGLAGFIVAAAPHATKKCQVSPEIHVMQADSYDWWGVSSVWGSVVS